MCKITQQVFKGHATRIRSILMSFLSFYIKTTVLMLFFLFFLLLNLEFTIYFYILVLYSVFWKYKLRSSTIGQIGKIVFTMELLTAANTLICEVCLQTFRNNRMGGSGGKSPSKDMEKIFF